MAAKIFAEYVDIKGGDMTKITTSHRRKGGVERLENESIRERKIKKTAEYLCRT